jgi:transcriptional regulator NrdR family protein
VKQTRNRRGYIARRRACPQCGIRLSTAERIVGSGNGAINDRGVISDPHLSVILDRLEEIARRLR